MQHPQWQVSSTQQVSLCGDLDRESVPNLWQFAKAWDYPANSLKLDLSQVERVDSAGMVMLIHVLEHAKKQNCHIMLSFVPEQLRTLCRLSNAEAMLLDHIES